MPKNYSWYHQFQFQTGAIKSYRYRYRGGFQFQTGAIKSSAKV